MTQEGVAASAAMATGARAEARRMRDFAKCIVLFVVGLFGLNRVELGIDWIGGLVS